VSKPFVPRVVFPAAWGVAVLAVAAATVMLAGPARLQRERSNAAGPRMSASRPTPAARARVQASYAVLPLAFEANEGQTDSQVKYMARGEGYKLFLTSSQAIIKLSGKRYPSEVRDMMLNKRRGVAQARALLKKRALRRAHETSTETPTETSTAVLRMNLIGANAHAQLAAENLQPGRVNYFLGRDRSKWRSNIPLYGRVNYRGVYAGVDLAFHGAAKQLEFDYLVSPGADAAAIALNIEGANSMRTDEAGDLILGTSAGPVEVHKPIAYQTKEGVREAVDARFVLRGKNEVAFALGPYDHSRELVIDPSVTYATYFGGDESDYGVGIAVDASGNAYVAGATDSDTIPAAAGGTVAPNNNGTGSGTFFDTFVTEISATGTCVFTTFFGGSTDDFPGALAIDSQGIYVAGTTDSTDFPVSANAAQNAFIGGTSNGDNDAFAVKLDLSGNFVWGTYIAGSDSDSGLGIAVDSSHNVYVVGETYSNDLGGATGGVSPLPNGSAVNLGKGTGADDGYIVKLKSDGTAYDLVSYIGGGGSDLATGVALDGNGNIYVSGETISTDLPVTTGVVQNKCGTDGNCNPVAGTGQDDAFVVGIKADLSGYNYVTYYGGSGVDDALAIASDASGNAFLTGRTTSSDFPTHGTPYQSALAGTQNAFVVELNPSGSQASQSTYFGGNGMDLGLAVALDSAEDVYLTGQTSSSANFPLANATQQTLSGPTDAFVSVLYLSPPGLLFSTYLGGGGDEDQFTAGIGLDPAQNIYVTGDTDSGNGATAAFPVTAGAIDSTYGGTGLCANKAGLAVPCTDAFIAAYGSVPYFTIGATALSPSAVAPGSSATSTVTVTPVNGYAGTVNLTCSVTGSGSPLPTCLLNPTSGNSSTLKVSTGTMSGALYGQSNVFYALWLPVLGLSLIGMGLSTANSRRKKSLGFLLLVAVMAMLFFLPGCSNSSKPKCTGCTPAGTYTISLTGTDSVNATLTRSVSPALTLTVN